MPANSRWDLIRRLRVKGRKKWIEPIYEHIYEPIYCSLLNISLLSTGLWYDKYDTYGKECTEMFLVNVRSMHILPRVDRTHRKHSQSRSWETPRRSTYYYGTISSRSLVGTACRIVLASPPSWHRSRFWNTPLVSPALFHRRGVGQTRPHWYSAGREHAPVFAPCKP